MTAARAQQSVDQLGPYQLLAKIGQGGTSTVHLAKMEGPAGFNKLAVIKELRAELTGSSAFRALFLNEMRVAARLAHPNVVHAYGASEDRGRLYLAMEYLDGQPWSRVRRVLRERDLLPSELHFKVLAEVLAGLHYAHELHDYDGSQLHVVHCDVSPQNVFVTHDGRVKVVDFGVARAVFRGSPGPYLIAGKLAYIAPEQLRGAAIDRRADLFAVGVMLWEAATGQRYAQTRDKHEARRRRESGIEPRMAAVAPTAPRPLVEICDRALALEPNERFATAAEFREALLNFVGEDMRDVDRVRLGQRIGTAFQKDRKRIHALLEQHLKTSPNATIAFEGVSPYPARATPELVQSAVTAMPPSHGALTDPVFSMPTPSASTRIPRTQARRTMRQQDLALPLLGALVSLLTYSITLIASRPGPHGSNVEAGASRPRTQSVSEQLAVSGPAITALGAATDPSLAPQPLSAPIRISIVAHPASVTLYLDGVRLTENPYTARLRADRQLHTLRAAASGYSPRTQFITFDRDRTVSLELDPLPVARTRAAVESAPVHESSETQRRVASLRAGSGSAASPLSKPRDGLGQPAHRRKASRPIYEQDPYR